MTDVYSAGGYEVEPVESSPAPTPEPPAPEPVSAPSPEPAPASPEAPAPSQAPEAKPEAPAPEATPPAPASPEPAPEPNPAPSDLFDLPDGRKVTAEQLREEYMNLLPEFTRKSQELAALKTGEQPINKPPEADVPEWKKEDYKPQTYAEVIEIAKREALAEIEGRAQAEQQAAQAIAQRVDTEIAAIKAIDPTVNENLLFQHANKYGFTDLTKAHANMVEMGKIRTETEQRTLQNVRTREADPVAAAPGNPVINDELDPGETRQYSNALDYLRRNQ